MKFHRHGRPGPRPTRYRSGLLEPLEPRVLLSGAVELIHPLAVLPNETALTLPRFSDQWHLRNTGQTLTLPISGPSTGTPGADLNAENAWDLTTGSNRVVIALFDTGVDLTHPDLIDNLWRNPGEIPNNGIDDDDNGFIDDVYGWNFVDNDNNTQDTSTTMHGTTVAGVLGARGDNGLGISGVAWNVDILTVKVGTDTGVTSQSLIAGINYVNMLKQRGVNIVAINASYLSFSMPTTAELNAIESAGDNGILYISAAGNSAINYDSLFLHAILPSNMLLVAATDNQDSLASFSAYGKKSVALAAPGVDILTTIRDGLYAVVSGTSYAGPMVSGTIALMKSLVPSATMAQIKSALLAGTDAVASLSNKVASGGRLEAHKALQSLLGAQAPLGSVDILSNTTVAGWAYDFNAGAKPTSVQIVINGVVQATLTADLLRPDLVPYFGSANHGYSFAIPGTLEGGTHTLQIYALDYVGPGSALSPRLLGQGTISVASPPIGAMDIGGPVQVVGWALDRDTPADPILVRLDIDGLTIETRTADLSRPDLVPHFGSANHGYAFTLPAQLSVGLHYAEVYALDTTTGEAQLIGARTINTNRAPIGALDMFNGLAFAGWAFDPNAGADPIEILYRIDGHAPIRATANVLRNDLVPHIGSAGHGFRVNLPGLTAGQHTLTVWAVDSTTQALTLLGQRTTGIVTIPENTLPRGYVDLATATRVAGWVYDANLEGAASMVRIDIDGVAGTPFLANSTRNDLIPHIGGANFGYDQALALSPGQHRIDVYTFDAPSDTLTLIGSRIVGTASPVGNIDILNSTRLAGWAWSSAYPTLSAMVRIDIDDIADAAFIADRTRNDLIPYLGGANFGFNVVPPRLAPGNHTLKLHVIDPLTLSATLITTRTFAVG